MRRAAFLFGAFAFAAAFAGGLDDAILRGTTDKRAIDYAPGEEMTFTLKLERVDAMPPGEWFIRWTRTGDDGKTFGDKVPAEPAKPVVVKTSLAKPGFVRLEAMLVDAKGAVYRKRYTGDTSTPEGREAANRFERTDRRVFFDGGAGVQPEKLQGVPEPQDFDAFHAKLAEKLAAVPVRADRREIPHAGKGKIYAVQIDCAGGMPVTGYLTIPEGAAKGAKYPCHLQTHGYSYRAPHNPPGGASGGEVTLNINAHGMTLPAFGATDEYYRELGEKIKSNGKIYAFDPVQNSDREKAYFHGMYLRVKRALQYLKTLPEWNGKDLIASGGSQGGLQTIWAAGCGEGVTRANSCVTWCCDMGGTEYGRNRGGWYIHWVPALGYYDPINVCRRIPATCKTVITRAGLGDYCCPPSGLAILYNNIPGPKSIWWVQGSTHGYVPPAPVDAFWVKSGME